MGKNFKRRLLVVAGVASVILGVVGIFVPVLPTTPFLLLAAFCFVRSSARLNRWLLSNQILGEYVRNYIEKRGMTFRLKIITLLLLWTSIGLSIAFGVQHILLRTLLFLVAIGVTAHILLIKTIRENKSKTPD
jgi:uncharacterized membrane protein YbaN (DUF454 family)